MKKNKLSKDIIAGAGDILYFSTKSDAISVGRI
jgi:hypothetical protein